MVAERAARPGSKLLPIDWGELAPLRLKARVVAEGVYSGAHRSLRRGAGVEFGGQRPYVPGDDLRFLDRRSLLRHDRLMIREFETETDRTLWLCLDASASMTYRGSRGPGAKLAYAALLGAALARLAVDGGDPVGLGWLAGRDLRGMSSASGGAAFDRLVSVLETAHGAGELHEDLKQVERSVALLARRAGRGSVVVLFSDLLDLPADAQRAVASLGSQRRVLILVQVLDPDERDLAFEGKVRLVAMEGKRWVETDADAVRAEYQARLAEQQQLYRRACEGEGGRLISCGSDERAVGVVRQILQAIAEART